ncbi:bifunctional 23S rRNA (guanine(2069)-N(7))-methyltransferase RlmK/23S rRNA (guanine(2445)-N(2))-methyltransferase RlmL [Exilibacterium tricleocarpae]|uniref:Ribosomal RNA large subunit methyltransferase K/L n=1 Tax=Exilibacterium tricleocarpae TaxID=2591008 RepID=A0A545TUU2_9GAMM|nr:bifunctional 23S rRNA (guanine(2069)-N(7))-methyltransferase RlmK/23S rRNA (guanine(2445)-N(2))-methyltransferase RlmL [Exilibacterium tricleocarpae]TQV80988.1 bifunctional 23S rRNA (guanine(2069)-N(7))-methyltransferase RlmK/23S rRNA (guanine(2445)-N(2))-methyltransferase RlmL [Exilibacterium tricleocarpae]
MSWKTALFATCPKGLEGLLLAELKALGVDAARETVAGVHFEADLGTAYRCCLWSRLANKVLLPLGRVGAADADALYAGVASLPWEEHLNPHGSLLVDFIGTDSVIRNSQFGAVKIKDAIVDRLRERCGQRPSVARHDPDLRINARLSRGRVAIAIDLSGDSLHRRGYRIKQGAAPLKENLAAALLLRAGWPALAAEGGALLDPMCGSGTLLTEAVLMAADIAPGLQRPGFGFERWLNHRNDTWLALREEAIERRGAGLSDFDLEVRGYDDDVRVIRAAEANIAQAGLDQWIRIIHKPVAQFKRPTHRTLARGLVICNPPYGERLGDLESVAPLYRTLGERLAVEFEGWRAAIFTGNPELAKQTGLRAQKKYKLFNGTIASELLLFDITAEAAARHRPPAGAWEERQPQAVEAEAAPLGEGAQMVANRLRKNRKSLAKWLQREGISCYRLYDADLPEYAAAVDIYTDIEGLEYAYVQEYAAPKSIDPDKAAERFEALLAAVAAVLELPDKRISRRQRRRTRGREQYEKQVVEAAGEPIVVAEGAGRFSVDLWHYLDTGLFLDHRPMRRLVAQLAPGARLLNLFCYTGSVTVRAALAGAAASVSVDLSNTYLNWARRNFALNHIGEQRHQLLQADCLEWLRQCREAFDLIVLDPPSFSNSKRMEGVLDIQRDHVRLIRRCMDLLNVGGTLLFSTNLRSFKLERAALEKYALKDISEKTLDKDFQRNRRIHQCWVIRHVTN